MKRLSWHHWLAMALPYVAVGVGLYGFASVPVTLAIYYGGIVLAVCVWGAWPLVRSVGRGWCGLPGVGLTVVFALTGVGIATAWPSMRLDGVQLADVLAKWGLGGTRALWFAAGAIIVNPLLEELFWRGCFDDRITRPSVIDAAFGGYHTLVLIQVLEPIPTLVATVGLCLASWALRAAKARCGGLAVPYVAHLAADVSIIAAGWWLL